MCAFFFSFSERISNICNWIFIGGCLKRSYDFFLVFNYLYTIDLLNLIIIKKWTIVIGREENSCGFVLHSRYYFYYPPITILTRAIASVQCCVDRFIILYIFCSKEYANRIGFYCIVNILINLIVTILVLSS